MLRKIFIGLAFIAVLLIIYNIYQLATTKSHSPAAVAEYSRDSLKIFITYSRPFKKGRLIFGEGNEALVPFGKVWRTGANEATQITVNQDIYLEDSLLKEGTYSLYTIPGSQEWVLAINSRTDYWGRTLVGSPFDERFDVFRVNGTVFSSEDVEQFTITFTDEGSIVWLNLIWDQTLVKFKIHPATPVTYALNGTPLFQPEFSEAALERLNSNLDQAKNNYLANPEDEMNIIWYGRRLAYLARYPEAIEVYTNGLSVFPESFKLYRHRGHRYISIREFDKAISDFLTAARLMEGREILIEPDGAPNRLNIPLSSTQFNVWYHLGLAYYLQGEFEKAYDAYQKCMEVSTNNDLLVATSDWLYMTCRRLGKNQEAASLLDRITPGMEIIENQSYLNRLLMYKGLKQPEELLDIDQISDDDVALALATQGYGVGNWYLYNGDTAKAREIFERITTGSSWSAFGYIAAEADLFRMKQ